MTDWKMSWLCDFEMPYMQYNSGSNSKEYGGFFLQAKCVPKEMWMEHSSWKDE